MSNTKHALGPWHRGSDDHRSPELWSDIYAANGALVARVTVDNVTSKERGAEHARVRAAANAMAAAPELLDACEEALSALNGAEYALPGYVVSALERAIAKATGEQL